MGYYHSLDIPYAPLRNPSLLQRDRGPHWLLPESEVDPGFTQWIWGLGLTVTLAQVFYSYPGYRQPIHVDNSDPCSAGKLNWIYGGSNSTMTWYRPIKTKPSAQSQTPLRTVYQYWAEHEVELALRARLTEGPHLVEVGQPHRVINMGPDDRWAVSVVLGRGRDRRLTLDQLAEVFRPWIKDVQCHESTFPAR